MALTWIIQKDAAQQAVTSFHLTDLTVYATGGNPARAARANFLFVTKTDKNGARTLLTVTPNTADPLTVSAWDVAISLDGLVEKIMFSLTLYSAGSTYNIGDIFYNSANSKIYKVKQNGVIGQAAPNTTYYDEITSASLYTTEIANTTTYMERVFQTDLIMGNNEQTLADKWEEVTDVFLNGKYDLKHSEADYIDSMINGAEAAMLNQRPYEAEEIVRAIENYLVRL